MLAACGSGSTSETTTSAPPGGVPNEPVDPLDPGDPGDPADPADPSDPACAESFDSTFDATQKVVFEGNAEPGSVEIAGAPMPNGLPALSEEHLEVLRLWIEAGAPESGSVGDSVLGTSEYIEGLLDACLPPATLIEIAPLSAPDPDGGVQFAMPTYVLPAATEREVCFAQYYDFSEVVPERFQDPEAGVFYVNGSRLRQDPHIRFDSADPAERTLTYCAGYNNGVHEDGSPDVRFVTRLSTMPARTSCRPVARATGNVGAACDGVGDDARATPRRARAMVRATRVRSPPESRPRTRCSSSPAPTRCGIERRTPRRSGDAPEADHCARAGTCCVCRP